SAGVLRIDGDFLAIFAFVAELTIVIVNCIFGIFQQVTGENCNNILIGIDVACLDHLFDSGERNGRCRLASDAVETDDGFCIGDLVFGDRFDLTSAPPKPADRFWPRDGISDLDGARERHGIGYRFELQTFRSLTVAILSPHPIERSRPLSLNDSELRHLLDYAALKQFMKTF